MSKKFSLLSKEAPTAALWYTLGEEWEKLSPEDKKIWEVKAVKAKISHVIEVDEYNKYRVFHNFNKIISIFCISLNFNYFL